MIKSIKNTKRVEIYFRKIEPEEVRYFNKSRHFREEYFIDINQKINNIIFFDSGRTKEFRDLDHRKTENLDAFFETIVSDPQNDDDLRNFITEVHKKYEMIDPSGTQNKVELNLKMKELTLSLIKEVCSFYGGNDDFGKIDGACQLKIEELKKTRKSNLIYLSDLKGCGVCRYRSILFKLLCDEMSIPCRILRGWFLQPGKQYAHMWNEVVLPVVGIHQRMEDSCIVVDSMNFKEFVPSKFLSCYRNLGHPFKFSERQRLSIERIKASYGQKRGRNPIGHGAFGLVYELNDCEIVDEQQHQKEEEEEGGEIEFVVANLAVKDINVSRSVSGAGYRKLEKIVKKEIEMMKLLRHPNIVEIIGAFSTKEDNPYKDTVVHIIMKKYDIDGQRFLTLLNENQYHFSHERKTIEVLILLLEIAKGLYYIHSFGIIHFDIKLQNILINWDKKNKVITEARITDFGSSKDEKFNILITSLPAITREYASPEILKLFERSTEGDRSDNNIVDGRSLPSFTNKSDVYSYGVLMSKFKEFYRNLPILNNLERRCKLKDPSKRPNFLEVINELKLILTTFTTLPLSDMARVRKHTHTQKKRKKKLPLSDEEDPVPQLSPQQALLRKFFSEKAQDVPLMDELSSFPRREAQTQFSNCVRELKKIGRMYPIVDSLKNLESKIPFPKNKKTVITFVGYMKSGKSSVVNKFFSDCYHNFRRKMAEKNGNREEEEEGEGEDGFIIEICPTEKRNFTHCVWEIAYGEKNQMMIELRNPSKNKGRFEIRPLPDIEDERFEAILKDFISELRSDKKISLLKWFRTYLGRVVIQINQEFMKNLVIVDTPGEGESKELSILVRKKLNESNVIVLVTDVSRGQFSELDGAHARDLMSEVTGSENEKKLPLEQRLLIVGNKVDFMVPEVNRKPSQGGRRRNRRKKANVEKPKSFYEGIVHKSRNEMLENINRVDVFNGLVKGHQVFATCCDVEETFGEEVYDAEFRRLKDQIFEMRKEVMFKKPLLKVFGDASRKTRDSMRYIWKQNVMMKNYFELVSRGKRRAKEVMVQIREIQERTQRKLRSSLEAALDEEKICKGVCEKDIDKRYLRIGFMGIFYKRFFLNLLDLGVEDERYRRDCKAVRFIMNKTNTITFNLLRKGLVDFTQEFHDMGIKISKRKIKSYKRSLFRIFKRLPVKINQSVNSVFSIAGYWDLFPDIDPKTSSIGTIFRKTDEQKFDKEWRVKCFKLIWGHMNREKMIEKILRTFKVRTSMIMESMIRESRRDIDKDYAQIPLKDRKSMWKSLFDSYVGLLDFDRRYISVSRISSPKVLSGGNSKNTLMCGTAELSKDNHELKTPVIFKAIKKYWNQQYLLMEAYELCNTNNVMTVLKARDDLCLVFQGYSKNSIQLYEPLMDENTTIVQKLVYLRHILGTLEHIHEKKNLQCEDLNPKKMILDMNNKSGVEIVIWDICRIGGPVHWSRISRDSTEYFSRLLQPVGLQKGIPCDIFSFGILFAKVWEGRENLKLEMVERIRGYKSSWGIVIDENKHGRVVQENIGKDVLKIVKKCTCFVRGEHPSVSQVLKWVEEIIQKMKASENQ